MSTDTTQRRPEVRPTRIHSLDGLRGAAALIVLIHHTLLVVPVMVAPYVDPHATAIFGLQWWLTYTPLHLLWDGSVAVVVFFVLSGFVLCLPIATGKATNWARYYPQRLIRLYLPVWGAVALSMLWLILIPRTGTPASTWVAGHAQSPGVGEVVRDLLLVFGRPGATNSALWSLKWEIIFSVLLPVFVILAARLRGFLWLKVALLLAALLAGAWLGPIEKPYQMSFVFHLPVFAVGCLMAFEWQRLMNLRNRIEARSWGPLVWLGAVIVTALLLSCYWLVYSTGARGELVEALGHLSRVVQVLGAAMLVFLAAAWRPLVRALTVKPVLRLGTLSFSLYLVHEPIIVSASFLLPNMGGWLLFVTVPVALLVAEVFYRAVEYPSHKLSQKVGSLAGRAQVPASR